MNSLEEQKQKIEKPEEFIPEAVSDAKHDIELLCFIEDGIELLVKAVNFK